MVDTRDLKSLGPKRPYEFESRPRHNCFMTMKKYLVSFAALFLCFAAFAQQGNPIPVDPDVRIGKLDNGLTYYIRHNAEPAGQANFYIAQKVGSILEEENQRGLAHFLEHMCFNGTRNFPGNSVIKYCESIGVKFGANLNAYTSIDETVYNIDNVPIAKVPSAVDSCLWILHDWADGLLLTDEDIDHERGVIHEEWRTRSNAQIRLLETILPAIYPGNRYGVRMPIGTMEVVDNFPYQVLRDYYEKWYRPDQQGVVVVGDFNVDEMEAKIKEIFSTIAKPENPAERVYFSIEDNQEPIVCLAKDKEQTNSVGMIFLKHDPYPVEMRSDLNYLVYDYAMTAVAVMLNTRLADIAMLPEAPFIAAQVADQDFLIAKTKKSFAAQVVSSDEGFANAMTTVYREMLRAIRCGFTESEYERAKAMIIAHIESAYNSRDKKKSADYCKEYVRHFIDNEPIPSIGDQFALIQQLSSAIPVAAINQMLAGVVGVGTNLVACAMLPDKEGVSVPSDIQMAQMLKAVEAETIEPYVDKVSDEALMSTLPEPGRIVKEKPSSLGYTEYTLSNGAKVYFRHTDFDADEVLMKASSFGGSSLYPDSDIINLKVVDELISEGGVGNFSKSDLMKVLAGKKASVSLAVGTFGESVKASSTVKDVETMLQLNYLYFTAIRKDDDAFASWKGRTRATLANREIDPMSAVVDSLVSSITTTPARGLSLRSSELDSVDYDRVLAIARERFANAADFKFIITGAVTEEQIKPLIERYIASLPASGKKEKSNAKVMDYKTGKIENVFSREIETPMVTNIFFDFSKARYNLRNSLAFDLALNALGVVLMEEIREKEGGTYGIGAYGSLSEGPKGRRQAYMQIYYQTSPDKYEYLNGRVREIVAQFAKEGPSAENLSKGKEFYAKKHKENIAENSYWASVLDELLETGIDLSANYEAVLESITAEEVRACFASMLKAGNHSEIIMAGKAK